MFRNLRFRILNWFLETYKFKKDEVIVIAIKNELTKEDLVTLRESFGDSLGDNVVIIGSVDKVIIAD